MRSQIEKCLETYLLHSLFITYTRELNGFIILDYIITLHINIKTPFFPFTVTHNPTMDVECERLWDEDGSFNISVSITLEEEEPTTHIQQLTISPTMHRNGSPLQTLAKETLIPQVHKTNYDVN